MMSRAAKAVKSLALPPPVPPPPCPPSMAPPAPTPFRNKTEFGLTKAASSNEPAAPSVIKSFFAALFGKKLTTAAAKRASKPASDDEDDDDDAYFQDIESDLSTNKQHRILQSFKMTKAMVPTRSALKTSKSNLSSYGDDDDRADSPTSATQSDIVHGFGRDSMPTDDRDASLRRQSANSDGALTPFKRSKSQRRVVCVLPDEMPPPSPALVPRPLHRSVTAPAAQSVAVAPESPAMRPSRLSNTSTSSFTAALDSVMGPAPHPLTSTPAGDEGANSPPLCVTDMAFTRRTAVAGATAATPSALLPPRSPLLHATTSYTSYAFEPVELLASASLPCVVPPRLSASDPLGRVTRPPLYPPITGSQESLIHSISGTGHSWPLSARPEARGVPSSPAQPAVSGRRDGGGTGYSGEVVDLNVFLREPDLTKGPRGGSVSGSIIHSNGCYSNGHSVTSHSNGHLGTGHSPSAHTGEFDLDVFLRVPEPSGGKGEVRGLGRQESAVKRTSVATNRYVSSAFRSISGRYSEPSGDAAAASIAGCGSRGGSGVPLHGRRSHHSEMCHTRAGFRTGQDTDDDSDDDVYFAIKSRPKAPAAAAASGGAATVAWVTSAAPGLDEKPELPCQTGMRL